MAEQPLVPRCSPLVVMALGNKADNVLHMAKGMC